MSSPVDIPGVDRAVLTPVVRSALGTDFAEVVNWQARTLRDQWHPVTEGLYRVSGAAFADGRSENWSVVLKVCRDPGLDQNRDPRHDRYWRREFLGYSSGLLADLPTGVRAARCYGANDLGNRALLWLEDLSDVDGSPWPLSRYGLAARHAGQLNGAYLVGRGLPDAPWLLARAPLHDWARRPIERLHEVADHPWVRRQFPDPEFANQIAELWGQRDVFYGALGRLPRCLCHLDLFRSNAFAVRSSDGRDETVAVDWQLFGMATVGEELAPLVCASAILAKEHSERVADLGETVFDGYLTGLRDAGWGGDARLARLGFAAGITRYATALSIWAALDPTVVGPVERTFGPFDELLDRSVYVLRYILQLADEARALIQRVVP